MAATTPRDPEVSPEALLGLDSLRSASRGRLFRRDIWDLFGSLLLSLQIGTRKQLFKAFNYAFTGEEALKSLASLQYFGSSAAGYSGHGSGRILVHLFLDEDDATALMQQFITGHMIKDVREDDFLYFRKKAIYQVTPKGLRALEDFIEDHAFETEADHLVALLCTMPSPRPKLWRLERGSDDEIIVNPSIVTNLFRRAVGKRPNYLFQRTSTSGVELLRTDDRNSLLKPLFKKGLEPFGQNSKVTRVEKTHCFQALKLLTWLCDWTSVLSMVEAAEMAAHFVRLGFIILVVDKAKKTDLTRVHKVTGYTPSGNPFISEEGEFHANGSAIYAITDEGARQAGWPGFDSPSSQPLSPSNSKGGEFNAKNSSEPHLLADHAVQEVMNGLNGKRLKKFIQGSNTRALFNQFLRKESCAYLLSFWIDVEDLKAELQEAERMVPDLPPVAGSSRTPLERMPSQQHQGPLNSRPFFIYNTYLAPAAEYQLSNWVAPSLRTALKTALDDILEILENKALIADMEPQETTAIDLPQLRNLVEIYGRIQDQVFCLLAMDFVPRFLKSPDFLERRLGAWAQDFED